MEYYSPAGLAAKVGMSRAYISAKREILLEKKHGAKMTGSGNPVYFESAIGYLLEMIDNSYQAKTKRKKKY